MLPESLISLGEVLETVVVAGEVDSSGVVVVSPRLLVGSSSLGVASSVAAVGSPVVVAAGHVLVVAEELGVRFVTSQVILQ